MRTQRGSSCAFARLKKTSAIAGVTVRATPSDAMIERMKATPSGPKKRPCKPDIVSTGRKTTATMKVA